MSKSWVYDSLQNLLEMRVLKTIFKKECFRGVNN